METFVIEEALVNGLRHDDIDRRNSPYLTVCRNLKPTKNGLKTLPAVKYPPSSPALPADLDWPFPVLHVFNESMDVGGTESVAILLDEEALYSLATIEAAGSSKTAYDPETPATPVAIHAQSNSWQIASARDCWWATSGTSDGQLIYEIPSNNTSKIYATTKVRVETLCLWNNRLVLGGFTSAAYFATSDWGDFFDTWQKYQSGDSITSDSDAIGVNWIAWSGSAGGSEDYPFLDIMSLFGLETAANLALMKEIVIHKLKTGELGMMPMQYTGHVIAIRQLGDNLLVFGDRGVSLVDGNTEVCLIHTGLHCIYDASEVPIVAPMPGGTKQAQLALMNGEDDYEFFMFKAPNEVVKLDYGQTTIGDYPLISYDAPEGDFWIGSRTGDGLVLTPTGLCTHQFKVTSLKRWAASGGLSSGHDLLGCWEDNDVENTNFEVTTCTIDFDGTGDVKEITEVHLAMTADISTASITVKVQYRFDRDASFSDSSAVTPTEDGIAFMKGVPGVEFRIKIEGTAYASVTKIERITVLWKKGGKISMSGLF